MDPIERLKERERLAELGGGEERLKKQHDAGQADRARAHDAPVRPRHVRGSRQARHAPLPGLRDGAADHSRRRRGQRPRPHPRPRRLCVRAGLHRVRRLAVGNQRRQDLQGDGHGDAQRRADRRPQRLRRRAHPGRRRLARRLLRHLPAQHAGLRRGAADFRDHGPLRRRRRLFAGDHRLHRDGEAVELHVRHRSRRDQDRHARRRHQGRPRRRDDAQREERRRALRRRGRRRMHRADPRAVVVHARQQPRRSAAQGDRRSARSRRRRRSTRWCRRRRTSPTTCWT